MIIFIQPSRNNLSGMYCTLGTDSGDKNISVNKIEICPHGVYIVVGETRL